ncbi:MAG: amino acid permease [Helicobacteraceae bacterium]|jgi:APA family basic amino acid/polyamine antiporter|nr:amino acid permease [Helicobacteraceae bacterium]
MAQQPQLLRKITMPMLLFYGLGNILGAGIYVLIAEVANTAGIYAPFSFLVALIIVSFTALSYAELASRYPDAAGVALYIKEGLGSTTLSIITGLTIALAGLISAATIARGFTGYLAQLIPLPEWIGLIGLIGVLGMIAVWGIGQSVRIAVTLTFIEIGGLLLILWIGLPLFLTLPERAPELLPPFEWNVWYNISLGAFLAFYAFLGFEDMANIAEEVKAPAKAYPKAIIYSLIIATFLYLSVSLVSVLLLSPEQLSTTEAPFATIYKQATGNEATLITVIGIFAIVNGALVQIIMASRMVYGISKKGWLPSPLTYINSRTKTPVVATLLVSAVTLGFALWLPLVTLANLTSFLILIVFTLVNAALIRIKMQGSEPTGVYLIPFWVPVAGISVNVIFLALQLFSL